jgi:hypothetical protein
MKGPRIRDSLEVIGLFGVIASLIFVGYASQARTDSTIELLSILATEPVLRSGFQKLSAGKEEERTFDERFAMNQMSVAALMNYENIHYQYLNGFVPLERWRGTIAFLEANLAEPGFRRVYESNISGWSPRFRAVVEEILATDQ